MWTKENRSRHDRSRLHYPTDLTDEEWSHRAFDPACQKRRQQAARRHAPSGQRPDVYSGTGCQWRAILKDLAARSTIHD